MPRPKSPSTVQKQITLLTKFLNLRGIPESLRTEAYETRHALQWCLSQSGPPPITVFLKRYKRMTGNEISLDDLGFISGNQSDWPGRDESSNDQRLRHHTDS